MTDILGAATDGRIWYVTRRELGGPANELEHIQEEIRVVLPQGGGKRVAALPGDCTCLSGVVSPDETRLAYATQLRTEEAVAPIEVWAIASGGSAPQKVATCTYEGPAGGWVYRVSWAPDSSTLAVPLTTGGRKRIGLVDVADRRMRYLATPDWADATCPAFSPDGTRVAYSCEDRRWTPGRGSAEDWTAFQWWSEDESYFRRVHVRPAAIWVTDVPSETSSPVTRTRSSDTVDLLPQWSPDGNWLAYCRWTRTHDGVADMHYWWLDLRVVESTATGDRPLVASDGEAVRAANGAFAWYLDSRRLLYMAGLPYAEGRGCGLMTVDATGGKDQQAVTPGMTNWAATGVLSVEGFSISPDGESAFVLGDYSHGGKEFALRASGVWRVALKD